MPPLKSKVLRFHDLLPPLSVSSVAPAFSISASLGALYSYAGTHLLFVVVTLFPSFFISSLALRMLNSISPPNAGASYHWGGNRFIGPRYGSLQAWIVTLAYFLSIPPIVLPAAQYTLQLLHILGLSTGSSGLLLAVTGLAWICISSAILITGGARPTALLTLLFLLVEGFIIAYSCLVGLEALGSHASVKVRPEWFIEPTAGIMPAFLVGGHYNGWLGDRQLRSRGGH
ncbi:APC family permease [Thermogymnomonas acidicola]|uniref:APC family permease n=1 Tax=Thermogymnomonas acidicola TaxID=399579 RepID=UPI00094637A3|nr:APC family permease [Thermogymnomonas acidicola]